MKFALSTPRFIACGVTHLSNLRGQHRELFDTVGFLLAFSFLNVMLNLRQPAPDPSAWYLLPSLDVVAIFGLFAALGLSRGLVRGRWASFLRSPGAWWLSRVSLASLGAAFVFFRIFRVGDGVTQTYQSRHVNIFVDSTMAPELVRLLHSTVPWYTFVMLMIVGAVLLPTLSWLSYRALLTAARYLSQWRHVLLFSSIVIAFGLASLFEYEREFPERYQGAFAASLWPTVRRDFDKFLAAREIRRSRNQRVTAARERLEESSGDLSKLRGANVLLFIIESYGVTLLKHEAYTQRMFEFYEQAEAELEDAGFAFASHVFDSPTTGGYSWLAHATLTTGMRIENQGEYKYVFQLQPKTLVHYFNEAGYRSVTAEPATKRPHKGPNFYGFQSKYFWQELAYVGPTYSWAPMPDQYVIDAIERRVISRSKEPLFVKYSLVSSHWPWNIQPPIIHNWDKIGTGAIYHDQTPLIYPTSWTDLSQARWPFQRSILYDLEVITTYLQKFVRDDTLVIVMGDHQPTPKVTDAPDDYGVPLHVISRRPEFVEKFIERGYQAGLLADPDADPKQMESFAGDFLKDFSSPKRETSR